LIATNKRSLSAHGLDWLVRRCDSVPLSVLRLWRNIDRARACSHGRSLDNRGGLGARYRWGSGQSTVNNASNRPEPEHDDLSEKVVVIGRVRAQKRVVRVKLELP